MDTKLKNRHKLFVVIWVLFVLCLSVNLDNMYMTTSEAANDVAAEMVAMAVAAWIFPMFRFFETGNEKIFYAVNTKLKTHKLNMAALRNIVRKLS